MTLLQPVPYGLWMAESTRYYEGKGSAPVIPSIHAVYKKGDWAFSGSFAVVGGGGKASFNRGLPMFDAAAIGLVTKETEALATRSFVSA